MLLKKVREPSRLMFWGVVILLSIAGMLFFWLLSGHSPRLDCNSRFIRNTPKGEFATLIHFHMKNSQGVVTFEGKYTPKQGEVTTIQRKVLFRYRLDGDRYFITSEHISVHADDLTSEETLGEIFNQVYLKENASIELTFNPINDQGYLVYNGTIPAYFCEKAGDSTAG